MPRQVAFVVTISPQGAPPGVRSRSSAVGGVIGTVIGAVFGRVWLSVAASAIPAGRTVIECAGWIVVALFVLAGVRVLRAPSAAAAAAPTWVRARPVKGWAAWFGAAVAVEFALIALGQHLLAVTLGHAEWTAVWVLLVVGFHFWPLAMILRLPAFRTLAGLLCGVALAAALCAALSGIRPLWSILPGVGGAAVLWGFSARALYGMYGGRWPSTPAAFSRSRTHGDGRTGR